MALLLAVTGAGHAFAVPKRADTFTELYLVTEQDNGESIADDYPTAFVSDESKLLVVGVLIADTDDDHLYITNLPREEFLQADLATVYRCRWEVETLFRDSKRQCELDEFDTSNPDVVEVLSYAALLSLLVSRDLLDLVTEQADDETVFPLER